MILEKVSAKYIKLSKKYNALFMKNKSLIDETCLKNRATNDLLYVDHSRDDEKNAMNDRIINFLKKKIMKSNSYLVK